MADSHAGRSGILFGAVLVAIIALVAAACGGSGSSEDETTSSPSPTPADTATPTPEPTAQPTAGPMGGDPMGGPDTSLPTSISLEARDNFFNVQSGPGVSGTLEAPANTEITVTLFNDGVLPHNISFFTAQGGRVLDNGAANGRVIFEAETDTITFRTPGPGTYYFQCTVHPLEMIGEFVVK